MESALSFMMNGHFSIAFRLVDLGFDVWLNNSRGSRYSREHRSLDITNRSKHLPEIKEQYDRYYDFSFHEMGLYDLPALFKFVMKKTKQKRLNILCHGQGFTQLFVSLSAYPGFYRKHMSNCLAFSPIVEIDKCEYPLFKTLV